MQGLRLERQNRGCDSFDDPLYYFAKGVFVLRTFGGEEDPKRHIKKIIYYDSGDSSSSPRDYDDKDSSSKKKTGN
jgi:hypothetical protein